jgi:hypothetical protein
MYKWHVNSAIGRGRPLAHDISRVTDGITASLRLFSVSAARAADDGMFKTPIFKSYTDMNKIKPWSAEPQNKHKQ